ncbi:MAG: hypothetical protein SPE23_00775, partial [Sodaliphilus sp.]|nr:hypothetical protein [Sodaliphilus sp.]
KEVKTIASPTSNSRKFEISKNRHLACFLKRLFHPFYPISTYFFNRCKWILIGFNRCFLVAASLLQKMVGRKEKKA